MTEVLQKLVITPEGEKYIPLSAEEIAQREADALAWAEAEAVRQAELAAKAVAKASAITKLVALGLTEEEIAAVTA